MPEQEIVPRRGGYGIKLRSTLPAEQWNAQISLLTGIAAARLMRAGGVGIFRSLPPADPRDIAKLRRTARALDIPWRADQSYAALLVGLDSRIGAHAAFLTEATSLFRGAAYVPFGGTGQPPGVPTNAAHAAIAAEYAHVTAPLRRLVDRYGTEICLALAAGTPVPGWVRDALAAIPKTMAGAGQRSGAYERAILDIVEAALLEGRVGEVFDAVVIDVEDPRPARGTKPTPGASVASDQATAPQGTATPAAGAPSGEHAPSAKTDDSSDPAPDPHPMRRGQVMLTDLAVRGPITGAQIQLGASVRAVLQEASVAARRVRFTL